MAVKITSDRNLAFRDQPEPVLSDAVEEVFKEEEAREPLREAAIEMGLILAAEDSPSLELDIGDRTDEFRFDVRIRMLNALIGEHAFPPTMEASELKALGDKSAEFVEPLQTESSRPAHIGFRSAPGPLPEELRVAPFMRAFPDETDRKRGHQATTVFPPENRFVFSDTRYPWSTCGRVDTPIGFGSGVMVGPRHLLTVSHVIQWNADGTAGWVRFRPSFFNGSAPFGDAWGVRVYFKWKVSGPTIDFIEGMYDYVCVVLSNRIGDLTGWMGSRGYTDAWDGGAYWAHVGYPGDLTAGNRPTYQGGIPLDGAWWQFDSHEAMDHRGDVWPGQSGGPFFGWWTGDVGPRAVAVQSSHDPSDNHASGGQDLVDLIIRARNEYP